MEHRIAIKKLLFGSCLPQDYLCVQAGIPLPEAVLSYMELKLVNSFDVGIHRIHSFEIICEEKTASGLGLAHIHRYNAQWRLDNHQPFKMYLR